MQRYTIHIDPEACVGDGWCCEQAPQTFRRDAGLKVSVVDPAGDPPSDVLSAAQSCRMQAIMLKDIATGEQVWPGGELPRRRLVL